MIIALLLLNFVTLLGAVIAVVLTLNAQEKHIMSAIAEFAKKQAAFNATIEQSVDSIVTSIGGLSADVKALNDKIAELQNSQGAVTPEDEALINEIEAQGQALADKTQAAAKTAADLDAATPPVPPTA